MTDLDDKLRQVLRDDRWALPTWPDPMARIIPASRRNVRRQQTLAVCAVAAVVAVAALVLVPLTRGDKSGSGHAPLPTSATACRTGWHVAPEPFAAGEQEQRLFAIAAASANDAWAVGESFSRGEVSYPVIEHWDGHSWTIAPTGDPPEGRGFLYDVAVISPRDVWAVGGMESPRNAPLLEHWDGTSWTVVSVPALTDGGPHQLQALVGVAAISANDVWALGSASVNGASFENPLLHWNGNAWTRVASPPASTASSLFTGIAVNPGTGLPWVVGGKLRGAGETSTLDGALLRSWNGSAWADRRVPQGALPLTSIAFAGRQQIWAIRRPALQASPDLFRVGGVGASTVTRWNGQRWTNAQSSRGNIVGIGVVTKSDIWIAGNLHGPLLMHWDGKSWTTPSDSAPVALPGGLTAIAVANDHTLLALGVSTTKPGGQGALWTQCVASSPK